jgi:DNA gyrase subunit A
LEADEIMIISAAGHVSRVAADTVPAQGRRTQGRRVVKRTALEEFSNPRAGGVKAAGVKKGDRITNVAMSDGRAEVMLLSSGGRAIRFTEGEVPSVGRTAQGVRGMSLKGEDEVVGMLLIRREANVLTVTEDAMAKRIPVVLEADEIMIISAAGHVSRVAADTVPAQGRRTQGRRVVKLATGDRVVEVTRTQGGGGAPASPALGSGDSQLDLLGG